MGHAVRRVGAVPLELVVLPDRLAISRLEAGAPAPVWATWSGFFSITQAGEELSIVCRESDVPPGIRAVRGWRALRVAGVLDLSLVGVLASLAAPLAASGVSLFALSTFETDYLLVPEPELDLAVEALCAAGHIVNRSSEHDGTTTLPEPDDRDEPRPREGPAARSG
jgi:hypothetical protein